MTHPTTNGEPQGRIWAVDVQLTQTPWRRIRVPRLPTTLLYFLADAGGALLYVGITRDVNLRWKQHAATKEWWPQVDHAWVDAFPDELSARAAEKWFIRRYRPIHNKTHAVEPAADLRGRRRSEREAAISVAAEWYFNEGYRRALQDAGLLPVPEPLPWPTKAG